MHLENALFAMGLTLFAGLSTGVGSAMAFLTRRTNTRFLSAALGFSAGVMIYVSFMEILRQAGVSLYAALGPAAGEWARVLSFFGGMLVIGVIDRCVPSFENPHEVLRVEELEPGAASAVRFAGMHRMGIMSAAAIAIHNFPEGLATFAAGIQGTDVGVPIAVAVAIHNVPEGIAVAIPIYFATGSRRKAFIYSFLSGLAEPVGALFGLIVLTRFMNQAILGCLMASTAGIMVFISLDELLPASRAYGQAHMSLYGLIGGMAVMALSLVLLR